MAINFATGSNRGWKFSIKRMPTNIYDQTGRYAVKLNPVGLMSWWLQLPIEQIRFRNWLDTRGIVFPGEPDRTNDTVAWLSDDNPAIEWALALEFCLAPDGSMFGRLLVYLGYIWTEKRPTDAGKERFCVGAIIINMTGQGKTSRRMRYRDSDAEIALKVVECNLETWDAAETLQKIATGELCREVLPWIPLLKGADTTKVRQEWLQLAKEEPDSRLRSEYGFLALIFAEAAGRLALWDKWLKGWNMTESKVVLELMEQGKKIGIKEGKKVGKKEGKKEGERNLLLRALENRFGAVPKELVTLVRSTKDLDLIRTWFDLVFQAGSMAEFRQKASI